MPFIGNEPQNHYITPTKDSFNGDASTVAFTLSRPVALPSDLEVFVDNVQQEPTSAYTVNNTTLTFTGTPATGTNNIYAIHRGGGMQTLQPQDGQAGDFSTLNASGDVSISGNITTDITMTGTTPTLTIGDAGAEDTAIVFDGNAQDYYIGLDDSADDLLIGLGSTVGTTPAISIDENLKVTLAGDLVVSGDDITMATNTSGAALIADGTNFNPVVISGDISIATNGVAAIGSGVIVAGDIASNAVTTAKINADAVTGAKIADDAINSEHYTDGSIDTAHIADDQITLAKMAGLARGKLIVGDASGNPAALAVGSNTHVLTSDGTDIAFAAASGGGSMTFISAVTADDDATISFTGIDSTYARYVFTFEALRPATDGAALYLLTSTNNGTGYDTGGSDYASSVRYSHGGTLYHDVNDNDAFMRLGPATGNATSESVNGTIELHSPSNAAMFTQVSGRGSYSHASGPVKSFTQGGCRKSAADVDAVRFKMNSGNITSGTIRLYGIANS